MTRTQSQCSLGGSVVLEQQKAQHELQEPLGKVTAPGKVLWEALHCHCRAVTPPADSQTQRNPFEVSLRGYSWRKQVKRGKDTVTQLLKCMQWAEVTPPCVWELHTEDALQLQTRWVRVSCSEQEAPAKVAWTCQLRSMKITQLLLAQ